MRDTEGQPVPGATVLAVPSTNRAVTDSAGRFAITSLDDGFYHVRARRIGFAPTEITTDLAKHGHVELTFELKRRPAMLDSVVVQEHGSCPPMSFAGFNCRK